jgi:NitT/TauT family transport system permease protein
MSKHLKTILFIFVLFTVWQLITQLNIYPKYLFPSPLGVFDSAKEGFADKSFIIGTVVSLKRIGVGFGLSVFVGVLFGFLLGRVKLVEDTIGPLVLGLQTLPSICWLPIAILWFGLNENAIIFVVIMGAFLAVTISTNDGVKNIPPVYLKAAQTMGAKGIKLYLNVLVPAATPAIITGMKLGWSFAWRSLMAGELLFVSGGLGYLLQSGRELNDINRVVAVMIVIIIIGLLTDRLIFSKIESHVRYKWGLVNRAD